MKAFIKQTIHKLILPRGRNYHPNLLLETGWEKSIIFDGTKRICILTKRTTHHVIKGLIILSHPYMSDAKQFFLKRGHAQMYVDNGFSVIIPDFNGFGESPFSGFNYTQDLKIVGDYAKKRFPDLSIFGHGISFGASHLLTFCGNDDHPFEKIIIENCLDSNLSYYKNRNKNIYYILKTMMFLHSKINKDHDYVKSAKKIKGLRSVLFLYNDDDTLTTKEMGYKIMENCLIPSTMVTFKGKHLEAFECAPDRYTKVATSFLTNK